MKSRSLLCLVLLSMACMVLMNCSPQEVTQPLQSTSIVSQSAELKSIQKEVKVLNITSPKVYEPPRAVMTIEPEPKNPKLKKARFKIIMPHPGLRDFKTQALTTGNINFIKVEVTGIGIATPLWADGADAQGLIPNIGGTYTVTVSNIPDGNGRVATLTAFDASKTLIAGAEVKAPFNMAGAAANVEISFRSTPSAKALEAMVGSTANNHVVSKMNLTNLQALIDTIAGTNPVPGPGPYTYTTHPTLVNSANIATDLLANGGDPTLLNGANAAYKVTPAIVSYSISGLTAGEKATVSLNDPASTQVTNIDNGGPYTINGITPGTWTLTATANNHTAGSSPSVLMTSGNTTSAGTIAFSASFPPTIGGLSATNGIVGATIIITGTNFDTTPANNTVKFGTATTTVTAATATTLTVTVPAGIFGNVNVNVTVGGQVSGNSPFDVTPAITSFNPTAEIIGNSVQINGSGFDPTPGNNTVLIGGAASTVTAASNSQLTINPIPAGIFGTVGTTVQVGTQTSASSNFNIKPNITSLSVGSGIIGASIQVNGSGFHTTAGSNTVQFNGVGATVTVATTTQLTVTVPTAATGNVTVAVAGQTSNGSAFNVLPTVAITAPLNAATVGGSAVPITTSFTSGNPVTQVEFFRDGATSLGVDTTAPYSLNWDASALAGAHTLSATITDNQTNTANATVINVTVTQPALTANTGQITFGTPGNPNKVKKLAITGPAAETTTVLIDPDATKRLTVTALDNAGNPVAGVDDYVWTFSATTPYPGFLKYPVLGTDNQADLTSKLGSGTVDVKVESLSLGLSDTITIQANDIPTNVTVVSVTPAPISNCAPALPSATDVVCNVTIAANTTYTYSGTFTDVNNDITVTEPPNVQAYESVFGLPGAAEGVAQPGNAHNVYLTGFAGNLSSGSINYGFGFSGTGGVDTKSYTTGFRHPSATGGAPGGALRMKVDTGTGGTRTITWNITVQ